MSFNNLARFGPVVIFVLAVLVGLCQAKVTFYEHFGFQGQGLSVPLEGIRCFNIPSEWNDRVSSIATGKACIMVYRDKECQGEYTRIAPGTSGHGYLPDIGFNDNISSARLC